MPQPVIAEIGAAGGIVGAIALGAVARIAADGRGHNGATGNGVETRPVTTVVGIVFIVARPAIIGVAPERCAGRNSCTRPPAAVMPATAVPAPRAAAPGRRAAIPA